MFHHIYMFSFRFKPRHSQVICMLQDFIHEYACVWMRVPCCSVPYHLTLTQPTLYLRPHILLYLTPAEFRFDTVYLSLSS